MLGDVAFEVRTWTPKIGRAAWRGFWGLSLCPVWVLRPPRRVATPPGGGSVTAGRLPCLARLLNRRPTAKTTMTTSGKTKSRRSHPRERRFFSFVSRDDQLYRSGSSGFWLPNLLRLRFRQARFAAHAHGPITGDRRRIRNAGAARLAYELEAHHPVPFEACSMNPPEEADTERVGGRRSTTHSPR